MKSNSQRFDRAIDALVKGYLNNTLAKGTCHGCAVGNMVAAACNWKVAPVGEECFLRNGIPKLAHWDDVFVTSLGDQRIHESAYKGEAKRQIDATGYSWQELAQVEKAFEMHTTIHVTAYCLYSDAQVDADQYRGLMAVVDVLCQIEGIDDVEPVRALFDKGVVTA